MAYVAHFFAHMSLDALEIPEYFWWFGNITITIETKLIIITISSFMKIICSTKLSSLYFKFQGRSVIQSKA